MSNSTPRQPKVCGLLVHLLVVGRGGRGVIRGQNIENEYLPMNALAAHPRKGGSGK